MSLNIFKKNKRSGGEERRDSDDYTVRKNKRADIIIGILSLICAVIIWVFVISSGSVTL